MKISDDKCRDTSWKAAMALSSAEAKQDETCVTVVGFYGLHTRQLPGISVPQVKSERYHYDEALATSTKDLEQQIREGLKKAGENPDKYNKTMKAMGWAKLSLIIASLRSGLLKDPRWLLYTTVMCKQKR